MPDRIRKINRKIFKFFKIKKTVFVLPKISRRKVKMFFQKLKAVFLKGTFRKKENPRRRLEKLSSTKSEIRNPKQYLMTKINKFKTFRICNFKNFNLFRISSFEFRISKARNFFKTFKSRIILKKAFALMTILAVIVTAYLQNTPYASAGTNYWDALGWSGGVFNQTQCTNAGGTWDAGTSQCIALHTQHRRGATDYTGYSAKDANIGTQISMTATTHLTDTATPTTAAPGGGFNNSGNVKVSTQVTGTDAAASVGLTSPWLSGSCYSQYGIYVYQSNSGNVQWQTSQTDCVSPQWDQHAALSSISTPADANGADSADITRSDTSAHVYWTTDQIANAHIGCSETPESYTDKTAEDLTHYNKSHMLEIGSLAVNTLMWQSSQSSDLEWFITSKSNPQILLITPPSLLTLRFLLPRLKKISFR